MKKLSKGFTIVELLVAVLIFSLVGGATLNLLVSGISSQRNALARQTLIDETSFLAEYVSRALRQARKELSSPLACLSTRGLNYESISPERIKFIARDGQCREIFFESIAGFGTIKERIGTGTPAELVSDDLDVEELSFALQGANQTDNFQPRATVSFHMKVRGEKPEIFFQTTISQRSFDVQQ